MAEGASVLVEHGLTPKTFVYHASLAARSVTVTATWVMAGIGVVLATVASWLFAAVRSDSEGSSPAAIASGCSGVTSYLVGTNGTRQKQHRGTGLSSALPGCASLFALALAVTRLC